MTVQRAAPWCTVAGSVLLLLGILAGQLNRQVLDGPRFARHVDGIRRDPAVARQIGQAITERVVAADPDLLAVRPLIEAAATTLAASPAFGSIVRASAREVHRSFTDQDQGQVALRLVDVGAVIAAALPAISPQAAARLPADLDVTLSRVGSQSFAARTIHLTRIVGLLAWLLPGLAVVSFAVGLWLASDRLRATIRTGWAIVAAGAGIGVVALLGAIVASRADESTLRGTLVAAIWQEAGGVLWRTATLTLLAGGLLVVAATARIPELDLTAEARRTWRQVAHRPELPATRIARGVAFALVGLATVLRPLLVVSIVVVLTGLLLLVAGVGEVAAALGAQRVAVKAPRTVPPRAGTARARWVPGVALVTAAVLVVSLIGAGAAPARRATPPMSTASTAATLPAASAGCNGHVELCVRRYNDVAFPATHNAMSAATEPGWFIPEQPTGLVGQLEAGVRVLLIDAWYGQTTRTPGLVATAPGSRAAALAEAERLYGADVVASALRVGNAVAPTPTGPIRPYLCHGLCEIGATEWTPVMSRVRAWLDAHPREVVTFFVEDYVSPADTADVFTRAGLLPYVHTQQPGRPWPTLGQLIDSGRRVVVLMENHGGGSTYPWLLQAFDWVQDTPFTNPTIADLSCAPNRGSASSPVFLVNYWLSNFASLVSDARAINAYDVLAPYLSRCRQVRGHIPNFVAVNFYNEGDLFRAVDGLNGVH